MNLGEIINEYRTRQNISMETFAQKANVSKAYIGMLEKNINPSTGKPPIPSLQTISKISRVVGIDVDTLLEKLGMKQKISIIDDSFEFIPDNIIPLPKMKKIPLVGEIACGVPILADENIEEYLSCPDGIHADFCLKCKGDSMIGSRIYNGDIVYIRKQEIVDNGEIAAVLIDGEATLKKVYITPSKVTLRASNPLYDDIVLDNTNDVHILGLAVAFFSSLQKPQAATLKPQESEIKVFAARDGDTSELNEKGKKAAKELFDNWDNLK